MHVDFEKELEMIIKWLKDSGLQTNASKTEICLFQHNDQPVRSINAMAQQIKTKKSTRLFGQIFDCKLNWPEQVANSIKI